MSYTKHTWEHGEVITAQKLNNIEEGIINAGGGDCFRIEIINDSNGEPDYVNATYDEIMSYIDEAKTVYIWDGYQYYRENLYGYLVGEEYATVPWIITDYIDLSINNGIVTIRPFHDGYLITENGLLKAFCNVYFDLDTHDSSIVSSSVSLTISDTPIPYINSNS